MDVEAGIEELFGAIEFKDYGYIDQVEEIECRPVGRIFGF